jgi:predicted DsbA family dithiol-disulfide isomerase/uncharacterized membrane protein
MRSRVSLSVCALVLAGVGLGASIASLVDYLGPIPTFCADTGCATVRASAWAYPLGIPMPVFGVAYFGAMLALAFGGPTRARLGLALVGGAWAVALVAIQALVLGTWCKLCLVADGSAFALAIAIAAGAQPVRFTWARIALLVPAVAVLPLALALASSPAPAVDPRMPGPIALEQVSGAVTVVEFVDFECPFCRKLAPELAAAIRDAATPVHIVRKMVPLPMHAHAMTAALAWCCADAQGKGEPMAAALFAAPVDELTADGCRRIAAQVGCDLGEYDVALAAPTTVRRIATDTATAKSVGIHNFPTVFIGDLRLVGGNHTARELRSAIEQVQAR